MPPEIAESYTDNFSGTKLADHINTEPVDPGKLIHPGGPEYLP